MDGRVLRADSDLRLTSLRIAAKDFPQFVEFLRAIERESRQQLVFKKQ